MKSFHMILSFYINKRKHDISADYPFSPVPVLSRLAVLLHQLFHVAAADGTKVMEAVLYVF